MSSLTELLWKFRVMYKCWFQNLFWVWNISWCSENYSLKSFSNNILASEVKHMQKTTFQRKFCTVEKFDLLQISLSTSNVSNTDKSCNCNFVFSEQALFIELHSFLMYQHSLLKSIFKCLKIIELHIVRGANEKVDIIIFLQPSSLFNQRHCLCDLSMCLTFLHMNIAE